MNSVANIFLKGEEGMIVVNGAVSLEASADDHLVVVHSHDVDTGRCRDTFVPREDVRVVSIEYRD